MDFDFQSIKGMMDGLDLAALLPRVDSVVDWITLVCRLAILIGPLVLVGMGFAYLFFAPKEANYYFGYRTFFGMGSVTAWRRTQKLAGSLFAIAGSILTLVMMVMAASMGGLEPMDAVWRAAKCLIGQTVTVVSVIILINVITAFTFDYQGAKRRK